MRKDEIITVAHLEQFKQELLDSLREMLQVKELPAFLTPKEFAEETGLKYSTVVYYCSIGKLAATQSTKGGKLLIPGSELVRLKEEALNNMERYP